MWGNYSQFEALFRFRVTMFLSDFHLGRTINIIQRCMHGCFIILDNLKSVNWPRERSVNAAGTTVYGRHHLDCYYIHFSCFPWQKFVWWYVLLFILSFGTGELCAWLGFFFLLFGDLAYCFGHTIASSYQSTVFCLWFSAELDFIPYMR